MTIQFSDKYQPLFDLLICRTEFNRLANLTEYTDFEWEQYKYYKQLCNVDTVLISGGRDSGKSFCKARFVPLAVRDYNHRVLFTRVTMASTDQSITQAIVNGMESLGIDDEFDFANNVFTHKRNEKHEHEPRIVITGQKTSVGTQTAKLKSLEGFSMFVTEEGEELPDYASWKKIKRSIRATDVQCINSIVFNPPTREHWIAEEFYDGVPDMFNGIIGKRMYIHTTYLDNGKENMADHNWQEYEELRGFYELYLNTPKEQRDKLDPKVHKRYREYKHDVLGCFKDIAEGVIYEDWDIGDFDESLPFCHGLDFGSNDPDAMVKVAVDKKRRRIYVREEMFKTNQSTRDLTAGVLSVAGSKELVVADSAGRRSITDLKMVKINIEGAYKPKDSVVNRIKNIQGYTIIITPESTNVIKAIRNYRWNDKKSGIPHHDWSDLMDAMGYGVMKLLGYNNQTKFKMHSK